jgi:hypothetical protein
MTRIIVHLRKREHEALFRLAEREYRTPRDQAALFIQRGLEQVGALPDTKQQPVAAVAGQEVNRERE